MLIIPGYISVDNFLEIKATFIAPVGIGLAIFVAELMGVYFTGGSLNPARLLRHLS